MTQTTPTKEQLALVDKLLSEWYEEDRDKRSLDCDGYTSLRAIFINTIVEQAEAAAASARRTGIAALTDARETIKTWHGPVAWGIYERCSPEMKRLSAAIDALKSTPAPSCSVKPWPRPTNKPPRSRKAVSEPR